MNNTQALTHLENMDLKIGNSILNQVEWPQLNFQGIYMSEEKNTCYLVYIYYQDQPYSKYVRNYTHISSPISGQEKNTKP